MDKFAANRVKELTPSVTLAISAKAKALKAAGEDIINLSAGEPDTGTPRFICEAAIDAINNGQTFYTAADGTPQLKTAIINKFKRDNKLTYSEDQVIASSGAKQAIFNLFLAVLNPGDEVLIPAPCWVSYPAMATIAEAKPVIITTTIADHYKITPEQLKAALTDKTRILVLNSPSNPTGTVYSKAELQALGKVLKDYPNVIILSDDIYEHIYWSDEPFANIAMACPELIDRTIVLNGVSKAYAMTGWRLGYAAGPKEIITVMKKIQSQSTSNPCSITQAAAVEALNGDQRCVTELKEEFKKRHDFFYQALDAIDGFEVKPGLGAFYLMPKVEEVIKRLPNIKNDVEFADFLLDQANVAVVPGSAFSAPGHIRLSYCLDIDRLKEAVERIQQVI